jgi:hydrogenase-4 component B
MSLYLLAVLLAAISGLPGLFLRRRGGEVAAGVLGLAALLGLGAAGRVLAGGGAGQAFLPAAPLGTVGLLVLDPVAAWFLLPVFLVSACGALFGLDYWGEGRPGARFLRLAYGGLTAALALLSAAAHPLVFLLGWEGMAIAAFFLVMMEERHPETRRAGWIYLVCTHTGTLCLFAAFALLPAGGGPFAALPAGFAASGRGTALFFLCLLAFGAKAGAMPLHIWLPPAHAAAPSHVSALMSGVLIKMGILGLVRLLVWAPDPPLWWGGTLMGLGVLSGVLGVAFALGQHDLKRLLAYHSIENIGIILMGLGLGSLAGSLGHPVVAALAFAGALLHVLNHGLFKALLFLSAGSAIHAAGTRDLDRLGGLGHRMPWTSAAFLAGAWAICGLPPLNGFVSEWLIYLGAFRAMAVSRWAWSAGLLAALALIGALALACFAKAFGAVFLGVPRTPAGAGAHESPRRMRVPMGVLALACLAIGLAPALLVPALDRVVAALMPGPARPSLAGLASLPLLTLLALALLGLAFAFAVWLRPRRGSGDLPTWDCGYGRPTPRMQYTASSFAEGLVAGLRWVLLPRAHGGRAGGLFPPPAAYGSHVPDPVLDRVADPALRLSARGLALLRFVQGGQLPVYLLYVLLTLLALLVWMVV